MIDELRRFYAFKRFQNGKNTVEYTAQHQRKNNCQSVIYFFNFLHGQSFGLTQPKRPFFNLLIGFTHISEIDEPTFGLFFNTIFAGLSFGLTQR